MSEFKLERFKYNWIGTWTPSYSYNRDDVVNVGCRTFVCLVTHTSSPDFNTDLDATVPGGPGGESVTELEKKKIFESIKKIEDKILKIKLSIDKSK